MGAFLTAIEQSPFSVWVRESGSVWSYPSILFLHTVGLALLVGLNVAVDLRILGFARDVPLHPLGRFFRFMWLGFWINAVSGTILLAADASSKLAAPSFYIKMTAIAAAMIVLTVMRRRVFAEETVDPTSLPPRVATRLAWASLACWTVAITAGRLMTYFAAAPPLTTRLGG